MHIKTRARKPTLNFQKHTQTVQYARGLGARMNAFEDRVRTKSIILKNNKTKDKVTWMDDNGVP